MPSSLVEESVPTVIAPPAVVTACRLASNALLIVRPAIALPEPTAAERVTSPNAPAFRARVVSFEESSIVPAMLMSSVSAPPEVMVEVLLVPAREMASDASPVMEMAPVEVMALPVVDHVIHSGSGN